MSYKTVDTTKLNLIQTQQKIIEILSDPLVMCARIINLNWYISSAVEFRLRTFIENIIPNFNERFTITDNRAIYLDVTIIRTVQPAQTIDCTYLNTNRDVIARVKQVISDQQFTSARFVDRYTALYVETLVNYIKSDIPGFDQTFTIIRNPPLSTIHHIDYTIIRKKSLESFQTFDTTPLDRTQTQQKILDILSNPLFTSARIVDSQWKSICSSDVKLRTFTEECEKLVPNFKERFTITGLHGYYLDVTITQKGKSVVTNPISSFNPSVITLSDGIQYRLIKI